MSYWKNLIHKIQNLKIRKRRIQAAILMESLIILTVSIAAIIIYTYYGNSKVILEQAENYMKQSAVFLKTEIINVLDETESIVNTYTPILTDVDLNNPIEEPNFIHFVNSIEYALKSHNYLTTLYFATPEGNFVEFSSPRIIATYLKTQGSTLPENTSTIIKMIDNRNPLVGLVEDSHIPQEVNDQWYYVLEAKKILPPRIGEKTSYDHRKRTWYKETSRTKKLQWSDIYVFASTLRGEKGITASRSIYDANGVFKGVFAADITLKSFSEFLEKIKVSPNAFSYIIEKNNEIIASSAVDALPSKKPIAEDAFQISSMDEKHPQHVTPLIVQGEGEHLPTLEGVDGDGHAVIVESKNLLSKALQKYYKQKGKENVIRFSFDGIDYISIFADFPKFFQNDWKAVIISPMDDYVGEIRRTRNRMFIASLIILAMGFLLAFRLSRRISQPIVTLSEEAQRIQELNFNHKVTVNSNIQEISDLSAAIAALKNTIQSFSFYIPKALVKNLLSRKQQIHVGGRLKEVTLMFTDIEGFTTVSENISPDKLLTYLSEYFEELTRIIIETNGTIDKYIGDAIMSFWGAPIADRYHTLRSCRAALLCQQRLSELNRLWKRDNRPIFNTRMGLHVGNVIIGNVGSSERMNYTAIGDSVNLCSRLEGLNKYYGTKILVSEAVYLQARENFLFCPIDRVAVKGKEKAVTIYTLLGQIKGDDMLYPTEDQMSFCEKFDVAYKAFLRRQFTESLALFQSLSQEYKNHQTLSLYVERCEDFIKDPPPTHWDGSVAMKVK